MNGISLIVINKIDKFKFFFYSPGGIGGGVGKWSPFKNKNKQKIVETKHIQIAKEKLNFPFQT